MASITVGREDLFANGTSVSAYEIVNTWTPGSGAPPGSAVDTAAVSGGSVTLTGLTESKGYWLYASSPDRYLRVFVPLSEVAQSGSGSPSVLADDPTGVAATDTANLQAALAETVTLFGARGGPVYLRPGVYVIDDTLELPPDGGLIGAGPSGRVGSDYYLGGTSIDATAITAAAAISVPIGAGAFVENLRLDGPLGGAQAYTPRIRDVFMRGFSRQVTLIFTNQILMENVHGYGFENYGLHADSAGGVTLRDCHISNGSGPSLYFHSCTAVIVDQVLWDESVTGVLIDGPSSNLEFAGKTFYSNNSEDREGIVVGDGVNPVTGLVIRGMDIRPFGPGSGLTTTKGIILNAGVVGAVLEDLTVHEADDDTLGWYAPGNGITDDGTGTVYRNVNGYSSVPTRLSAPSLADFDAAFPGPAAAGPILDLGDGRAYFRLPDDTIRYTTLSAPLAPANLAAPAITGTLTTGSTIACSTGTWQSYPTSYAYQWKRGGANIGGATASTYLLAVADEGANIKCTVTATNTTGSTPADSNTVVPHAPAAYRAAVLTDSPVIYLRLEENPPGTGTAADETTNHPGTYVGSPPSVAGALTDVTTGVDFDGSTQYVTVPDHAALDLGDVFTMECFVKPGSSAAGGIIWKSGDNGGYRIKNNGNGVWNLQTYGAGICTATTDLTTGVWQHIAVTKNGATVKMYRNGVDVTGSVSNVTVGDTVGPLWVGRGEFDFFDGSIDEVAVYPTALSAARILAHYNAR
jgi:hypothetical protein